MDGPENPDERNPVEGAYNWYPLFKVPPMERSAWRTDEQWAIFERDRAEHYDKLGIYLRLFQALCATLGSHHTCRIGKCRRNRDCLGRRPEDDWSFPLKPLIPPCVPLDPEIIEPLRDEIRHELERMAGQRPPRKASPHPPRKGRRPRRGAPPGSPQHSPGPRMR
ncbi:hypothetical protein [Chelativorans alearense]|uniref:hypothetical protein n=1 Tax=Chelativorans alearense TaxID=2681495 RepID=UPI0013D0CC19|nr:hypothetical protein [Chelativorans alearense]